MHVLQYECVGVVMILKEGGENEPHVNKRENKHGGEGASHQGRLLQYTCLPV